MLLNDGMLSGLQLLLSLLCNPDVFAHIHSHMVVPIMTLNFELEPGDKLEQLERPLALSDLRLLSLSPTPVELSLTRLRRSKDAVDTANMHVV